MKSTTIEACIHIYISPDADLDSYPTDLCGDMSVFKDARTIQHEVQWLFYLMLKDQGLDIRICRDYPKSGILLIHKAHVKKFVWNPDLLVVSLQWDYNRDDRAQVHLVSNNFKTTNASLGWMDRLSFAGLQCYVPPVMHPVILPRDPARGDRFENIAFIGDPKNLDKAFRTAVFRATLEGMGMKFIIRSDPDKLADFTDIDAVVAIRRIGKVITNKPSVKLINAWRGGVPSILGVEIGCREARQSEYDYIEVDSVEEVIAALKMLKGDVDFRNKMLSNGKMRAEPFTAEGQQRTWIDFFRNKVLPAYSQWQGRSAWSKRCFLSIRWIRYQCRRAVSFIWHRVLGFGASHYR